MTDVITKVSIGGQVYPFAGGGSSGEEHEFITQEEYEQLTPAQKAEKVYMITGEGETPTPGGGGSGGLGGLGNVATVGLFANANGGNFGLLNNIEEYNTNVEYNTNRADNTQTGDGELSISVTSPSFADSVNSINKANVVFKIDGVTKDGISNITSSGQVSQQKTSDFLIQYGETLNVAKTSGGSVRGSVTLKSVDQSGNTIQTYTVDMIGSSQNTYYSIGHCIYQSGESDSNAFSVGVPYINNGSISYRQYYLNGHDGIEILGFSEDGKYIIILTNKTYTGNRRWRVYMINTQTKESTEISTYDTTNTSHKFIQSGNLARLYYIGGYLEINMDDGTYSSTTMTGEESQSFIDSHIKGEYDNFNSMNVLINEEQTTDGNAYFNGEIVGKGYFTRYLDNATKEYIYSNSDIIEYSSNSGYVNLKVGGQIVWKGQKDNGGWGIIPSGNITYSTDTHINTSNPTLTLEAKGLGSTGNITIQPTTNGLTDTGSIFQKTNNATWLELGVEGYEYASDGDILFFGSLTDIYTDISNNLNEYSLIVYQYGSASDYSTYSFISRYLVSGEITINNSITINIDKTQVKSNSGTKNNFVMIGYK